MRAAFKGSIKLAAALYAAAATTPALLINLKAACDSPGKHLLAGGERRLGIGPGDSAELQEEKK